MITINMQLDRFKKFFSKLFLVIATIFLLDLVVGLMLEKCFFKQTSGLLYRTTYSMDSTKADILIIGSSRANHHYVPQVFEDSLGMSFYNTGRDGNGIFYQIAVFKSVIKRYTPKIIIFDYYNVMQYKSSEYDRLSTLLPYYRTHPEVRDLVLLKSWNEKYKNLSRSYPFNSIVSTIMVGNMEMNKLRKSDEKGYVRLKGKWDKSLTTEANTFVAEVDPNKIAVFNELLQQCTIKGIKLYVVYSPIYLKDADVNEIKMGQQMCAKFGVPFFDFSKNAEFLNSPQLFHDISHLNHEGALKFSQSVIDTLKYY